MMVIMSMEMDAALTATWKPRHLQVLRQAVQPAPSKLAILIVTARFLLVEFVQVQLTRKSVVAILLHAFLLGHVTFVIGNAMTMHVV
jgi:hypothetical protein